MKNTPEQNNADTQKKDQPEHQGKNEQQSVKTVTPDNDNGDPGPPSAKDSSNKGKGPKGENL